MGKREYTVLVFSQQAAKVKKFILSPLTLKVGATVLAFILGVSGYLTYNYLAYQKKLMDLRELRKEINTQQSEIQSFLEKISLLEEQLSRLKSVEEQVKKDLKEVQELKEEKRVKKIPSPPVTSAGPPKPSHSANPNLKTAFFREEGVSILEKERPRLVSRIQSELLELSKKAFQREQTLKELQEFLQQQKSILLSIPSLWPVLGRINSPFGDTRSSISSGGTRPHMGVDIGASTGTPVLAPAEGKVSFVGREAEYGLLVMIDHGHGFTTAFGHLSAVNVIPGERVKMGQVLGAVGMSGNTTGPHLHYEVRVYGKPVNPALYLNRPS